MRRMSLLFLLFLSLLMALPSQALVQNEKTLKSKAFMKKSQKGLYQFMDLKKKQVVFDAQDKARCKNAIQMNWKKMKFRCVINLQANEKSTKLHKMISKNNIEIQLPHLAKKVHVKINKKTNYVVYQTSFDKLGIDLDEAVFNQDLREVYAQTATEVISRAMAKPLVFTVLESH